MAGIRLQSGRTVWADAGEVKLAPLDTAVVRLAEGDASGTVFATPEQIIRPPEQVDGKVVEVRPHRVEEVSCGDLPGADLPYLGTTIRTETVSGRVTALDAVHRLVTLTREDGSTVEMPADDLH